LISSGELSAKKEKESRVKQRYQTQAASAQERLAEWAQQTPEGIKLTIGSEEVAEMAQGSLGDLLRHIGKVFIETVMESEVETLVGRRHGLDRTRQAYRWGREEGYCVIDGQKVPLRRPRIRSRDQQQEIPLASYELFQQGSLIEETVWQKIMYGLTMRNYKEVVAQFSAAYGLEKSTVSTHFIEASRRRLAELQTRQLEGSCFPVIVIDGTIFKGEHLVVAIGVERSGRKVVLGLQQGATENATVVGGLLADLQSRGVNFSEPRLYLVDGGKAIHKAIHTYAGEAAFFQRCQVHKIRNIIEYLPEEQRGAIHYKLRTAYAEPQGEEALRQLQSLELELEARNPSAAGSLREGMAETITVAELRLPPKLRTSLASTNAIESSFSVVGRICAQVKRWQGRDHRLRWIASALLFAETRWNAITGYRHLPQLITALDLAHADRLRTARQSI